MTAPATLLRLMWLASPALPVGGFSYSEGLEAALDAGRVQGEAAVGDWLLDQLHLSLARADLPACAQAFQAWQAPPDACRLQSLNDWVLATRESAEFRLQTEQMGRSLVEWLRNGEHAADPRIACCAGLAPAPSWPVAFALACVLASGTADTADDDAKDDAEQALLALAFGWAENMAQAAMKSVPLGQAAAQRILTRLTQAIPEAVQQALSLPEDARQAFTPGLAILSARHENQYSRLFRS
ncbi:MAG: urease accessory protein UreF [Rubrivivax sp.]|jgi:urease accessory protein|nr:urease accessory protein UreF [Rubrivivax sp.]